MSDAWEKAYFELGEAALLRMSQEEMEEFVRTICQSPRTATLENTLYESYVPCASDTTFDDYNEACWAFLRGFAIATRYLLFKMQSEIPREERHRADWCNKLTNLELVFSYVLANTEEELARVKRENEYEEHLEIYERF